MHASQMVRSEIAIHQDKGTVTRSRATLAAYDIPPGSLRTVKAKEHVFLEGDQRQCAYEIVSGSIALFKLLPDGRRQICRFALPGDFLGLGWEDIEPCGAEATIDSVVKCLPSLLVRRAADYSPSNLAWIGEKVADELQALRDLAQVVALGGALERVAAFVVALSRRIGSETVPTVIELPMTRADIGDHLGLTLETVSRELSRLRRMQVIDIDHATHVTILDTRRLERIAQLERMERAGRAEFGRRPWLAAD